MKIEKFRDLTIISIDAKRALVVSCDSSGGVGNKERDVIKVPPNVLGYFTSHVALSEVISVGAEPMTIINTLSVEMDNTGMKILKGIKEAIKPLNLDENKIITGSTEENFPVCQTGMGITVIGIINKSKLNSINIPKNSMVVVAGIPKVGNEVKMGDNEILSVSTLIKLREKSYVYDILPVGSKGILYEINEMARTNGLKYILNKDIDIDLNKSAGPSTCAVLSVDKNRFKDLKESFNIPIRTIGKFI
ncbi:AIR synthase related protein [Thermohalobacter berrensis]|uniref:Selenophosphate synthase n=1 Tax=Thermohalobacter berrensis TaxID=99594 RepID=A0A419SZA2_9FIRM|nr:AIR synthase related protein [Thermohalobacter berrensis]RKD30593.1 selenophosphate synthase [Thermohalobacter berrensis]